MLKSLLNSLVMFVLLVTLVVVLAWSLDYVESKHSVWPDYLIPDVQAGYVPVQTLEPQSLLSEQPQTRLSRVVLPVIPQALPQLTANTKRILVQFPRSAELLNHTERGQLNNVLRELNLDQNHAVKILVTPASQSEEDHISSSHVAKLRAQSVARIIYPYTQQIEVQYHADARPNYVIIEFD